MPRDRSRNGCRKQVEAGSRWTGQHVLTDSMQQYFFQEPFSIFLKPGNVELHNRARSPVGSRKRLISAWSYISIDARFTLAEDTARRMARYGLACMIQPSPIASGDQHFSINAAKTFGIGILNNGSIQFTHRVGSPNSAENRFEVRHLARPRFG